jgi:Transposase DDE domain group 1
VHVTGWSKGLDVTSGGAGIVSHAGLVLLRSLADKTGLTGGLSKALATPRLLIHDRGRVLADLATAIAGGAEVISDFAVLGGLREIAGPVASVPTTWRTLNEIGAGGPRARARITRALNAARRQAWAGIEARHGALPAIAVADKKVEGVTCIRLDATVTPAHSDKEGAEPNYKGFGHHPLLAYCDNTAEPLAGMLRPGSAGANTTADHLQILEEAITAVPAKYRRRLMVTCDGAGASHGLITRLDELASRAGRQLTYSIGWSLGPREREAINAVPGEAWQIAIDPRGRPRVRRADDNCADPRCAHPRCWREEAHVSELTGLLRESPGGDQLAGWPASMRVFARRERPHPGAQLSLFEEADGWRYSLWVTNLPATVRGWRGQLAYIDVTHRVHARVEDRIRTGKDCGLGRFPSQSLAVNSAWLAASLTAAALLSWLQLLALDGDLAKAEPKTLRYRILHTAARLTPGLRRVPDLRGFGPIRADDGVTRGL